MATTTPNIGLTLPTGTEGWKRSVINGNFSILDTKIGAVGNTPLQTQINTLSSQIMKYQGSRNWTSGANCNNYTTEGLYMLSDNLTNAPLTWFTLIVYAPRNDAITQIAMKTQNAIYVRFYTSSWSQWVQISTNDQVKLKRIVKTYSNVTLPNTDNPYVQIDDYNGLGVNTTYYLVSMGIRGWNNTHVGSMSLAKSSNGSEFYIMGATGGTIGSVTVEYFFVPSVDAL